MKKTTYTHPALRVTSIPAASQLLSGSGDSVYTIYSNPEDGFKPTISDEEVKNSDDIR